jgi:DNA replication and repair protein RecF
VYISRLALDHFRSWDHCILDFSRGVNILQGYNGLGKTNIVEAVEVLSTGSSHRVSSSLPLVEYGESKATIRANVMGEGNDETTTSGTADLEPTTFEATISIHGANRARINGGSSLYMRDIVGRIPSISFTPEDQSLVSGDPSARRGFLDQAGALLIHGYMQRLQTYSKIAKQRAALLKQLGESQGNRNAALSGLEIWTGQFIENGLALTRDRIEIVKRLEEPFSRIYASLAGPSAHGRAQNASMEYQPSFTEILSACRDTFAKEPADGNEVTTNLGNKDISQNNSDSEDKSDTTVDGNAAEYDDVRNTHRVIASGNDVGNEDISTAGLREVKGLISQHFQRIYPGEVARGRNLIGPHRDDVMLRLGDMPAKEFASNGEMWTLALALKMALFEVVTKNVGITPIVILDDVFAQLDETRRHQILDFAQHQQQVLITVAAASDIPDIAAGGAHQANVIDLAELKQSELQATRNDTQETMIAQLATIRESKAVQPTQHGTDTAVSSNTSDSLDNTDPSESCETSDSSGSGVSDTTAVNDAATSLDMADSFDMANVQRSTPTSGARLLSGEQR